MLISEYGLTLGGDPNHMREEVSSIEIGTGRRTSGGAAVDRWGYIGYNVACQHVTPVPVASNVRLWDDAWRL